jgi:hypothetical protein
MFQDFNGGCRESQMQRVTMKPGPGGLKLKASSDVKRVS